MKREHRVLVMAALLPMLVGALVLWATGDRAERLDAVPAAVVNLDEPVGLGKGEQPVAAGRLLAAGLTTTNDHEDTPLAWRVTNAEDASAGLRRGDYHAVITIPEDFSETVAGLSRNEPGTARVTVRTNDASSALAGAVGDQVADVAARRLNERITASFVEGVYARTGELKTSLGEASGGADRLADGAGRLGQGSARLAEGAGALAGGLDTLSGGAGELADGAGRLASGADELAAGTTRLTRGSDQLASGAGRLAGGLDRLRERTEPLPGQARELADGAGQVAEGVEGWSQVLQGWKQACAADPVLAASHARLCAATVQAVGADDGNARAMVSGARQVAAGADTLADGTPRLVSAVAAAAGGAERLVDGADRLATGSRALGSGARELAGGAERLDGGARELAGGASQASSGADRLSTGSTELVSGTQRLGAGSRELTSGLEDGARQIPALDPDTRQDLARAVAEPVAGETDRLNALESGATGLAPGVLALAIWLGALVTYLVRRALPQRSLAAARPAWRVAWAGWLPAAALGAAQTLLLVLAVALLGVTPQSPLALAAFLVLPVVAFTALNQAVVAVLGERRGWLVAILLTVLQAVSLGGLVPVETAPGPVQTLNGVLPVPLAAEGIGALVIGGQVGSVAGVAVLLGAWAVAAFAVSVLAARRRQRVTPADVRRRLAASPG